MNYAASINFFEREKRVNRRRFIAGAVCPRCSAMDKIVVDLDTDERECVACGFSEGRPQAGLPVSEPVTRVSRPAARLVDAPAEAVTLIDPLETKN